MVFIVRTDLERLCACIFQALGIPQEEAEDCAEILVTADARGIKSHGVARITRYANGIRAGLIKGGVTPRVLHETPCSLVLDGEGAMGLSLSKRSMERVIAKAREQGMAFCSIRNSNHFGIAGFYTEMAAREDMIGLAMTNTAALGVPTFARKAMFGTNPIAFAAPGLEGMRFSLDMATTTVPRGKIEVYQREGKELPPGWAVGSNGLTAQDPRSLLDTMIRRQGGGLLPLGGAGETHGGYKGYGLAVLVDILCALTSGGVFGEAVRDSEITSARVCHCFMAIRLDILRPPEDFKRDMSRMLEALVSLEPAEGASRVYYPGLKEQEAEGLSNTQGVPLAEDLWQELTTWANVLGVALPSVQAVPEP